MLRLRSLLTGDLNRLRYIPRFSTAHVNHKENVAEHSYYVVLYSYLICCHLELTGHLNASDGMFQAEVLAKAILHDCEESVTGDMPRMFKYRHSGVHALLQQAGASEVCRIAKELFPENLERPNVEWKFRGLWEESKSNRSGAVVALADFLSVLSHMMLELEASNWTMAQHYSTVYEHFETFKSSRFDFLRDLIDEAERLTREAFTRQGAPLNEPTTA